MACRLEKAGWEGREGLWRAATRRLSKRFNMKGVQVVRICLLAAPPLARPPPAAARRLPAARPRLPTFPPACRLLSAWEARLMEPGQAGVRCQGTSERQ